MVLVPSHRSSSFLEACACTPEAPASRRTAHPIRKVPTTAMRCPRRTTTHPPSLTCVPCYLRLEACHTTKPGAPLRKAYSPKCVEGEFCELLLCSVFGSSLTAWLRNA